MTRASALRTLFAFGLTKRRMLAVTASAGVCHHAFTLGAAAIGAWLVGRAGSGDERGFGVAIALLCVFVVAAALARWWHMWVAHDFAYQLLAELRVRVYDGLERIAPAQLLGRRSGDIASLVMNDVEAAEWFYAHTVADYVASAVVTVGVIGVLLAIHPLLAAALLPCVALLAAVPFWLSRRAVRQGRRLQSELGVLGAEVVDGVQGLRELVAFGAGRSYLERLLERTRSLQRLQLAYGGRAGLERAAVDALLSVGLLAMLVLAALLVARGELAVELAPAAIVLAAASLAPIAEVSATAGTLGQIRAGAERVLAVIEQPARVVDGGTLAPTTPIVPAVSFEAVRFRYAAGAGEALRGASFEVAPGESVALVGPSGAGKSTSVNLLLRFWDVGAGSVRIGGHDVRELPLELLRARVAVVPQDVYLFNMSVRDNILLGRPDASGAEVERAARQAVAHDFISELPEGYETVCGERGVQLSGGQRQRIAIARALLKDAPILVLDEAVSSLDARSEQELRIAIDAARAERTTLLVAHRASTIAGADRVVMLEHGTVVACGTHTELLSRNGPYRRLLGAPEH